MAVTTTSRLHAVRPAVRSSWAATSTVERVCYAVAAALLAAGVFHLGVFAVRGGPWEGPVSWRKPATFGLSFGLTLLAVTWVTSYLRLRPRTRAVLLAVLAADSVVEVAGITVQRQVPPTDPNPRAAGAWFFHDYTQMDDQQHAGGALLGAAEVLAASAPRAAEARP